MCTTHPKTIADKVSHPKVTNWWQWPTPPGHAILNTTNTAQEWSEEHDKELKTATWPQIPIRSRIHGTSLSKFDPWKPNHEPDVALTLQSMDTGPLVSTYGVWPHGCLQSILRDEVSMDMTCSSAIHRCSTRLGAGKFGVWVNASSSLSRSLGNSWEVFIVWRGAFSCWWGHCHQGSPLPWRKYLSHNSVWIGALCQVVSTWKPWPKCFPAEHCIVRRWSV